MKKELIKVGGFFAMLMSLLLFANRAVIAGTWAECRLNGQIVSCDQLAGQIWNGFGLTVLIVLIVFGSIIGSMYFWILMIVHVAKNPSEDQAMWIILMVFTGLIGAIVYYFSVKKPLDQVSLIASQRMNKKK